jgi:hypothetical protein
MTFRKDTLREVFAPKINLFVVLENGKVSVLMNFYGNVFMFCGPDS